MKKESEYQALLIRKLHMLFPESLVLKNDANYIQGFPDLLILHKNRWAALETKRTLNSSHRPNQDYYVNLLNEMSYASFISPENEKEVFNELQRTLESN